MTERREVPTRAIHVAGSLLPAALLRLRREHAGQVTRWTLGDHGSVEIDAWFGETEADSGGHTAAGWLFGPEGDVVRIHVVAAPDGDTSRLSLTPQNPLPARWECNPDGLRRLARAALTEIAEELCWQASRSEQTTA